MRMEKRGVSTWPFEFKHMSDVVKSDRGNELPGDTGQRVLLMQPDMKMETMLKTSATQRLIDQIPHCTRTFIMESFDRMRQVRLTILDL